MIVIFKAIVFIENDDMISGHYFYNAPTLSNYNNVYGVPDLTLPKAIAMMQAKGIDPIKNFRMTISVYYS